MCVPHGVSCECGDLGHARIPPHDDLVQGVAVCADDFVDILGPHEVTHLPFDRLVRGVGREGERPAETELKLDNKLTTRILRTAYHFSGLDEYIHVRVPHIQNIQNIQVLTTCTRERKIARLNSTAIISNTRAVGEPKTTRAKDTIQIVLIMFIRTIQSISFHHTSIPCVSITLRLFGWLVGWLQERGISGLTQAKRGFLLDFQKLRFFPARLNIEKGTTAPHRSG